MERDDDVLRRLFNKIEMEKVPDNFTSEVMGRIHTNTGMEPAPNTYIEWWWILVGVIGTVSLYLSGTYLYIYELLRPPVVRIVQPFAELTAILADKLPSNTVMLPSSIVLPSIVAGVIIILFADTILGHRSYQV